MERSIEETAKRVSNGALEELISQARVKHVPGGQILLYEEDMPAVVYLLKTGVVKIYDIDDQGNEKILHLAKPPSLVPFAFFSGLVEPLKWYYSTLTDCDLYVLSAQEITSAVNTDAALAMSLTRNFSIDVHELLVRLSSLSKTSARDKVLAALRFLAECHSTQRRSGWCRVNFPVSHQLIADICGITRESAALVMKELQPEGLVRNPRQTILEIHKKRMEDYI